ncbi:MAG: DNA polymerase III subunit gamma/tau [Magnetovibrionaceae bacterium]
MTPSDGPPSDTEDQTGEYRVLARKYRPGSFDELIGQEAMVRTLSNAMAAGRLAHAFVLTGVRGIGKTTTARIIARGLNCIGEDGTGGPTTKPCGVCKNCTAIAADSHMDVLEMDAASRTGVDDIRELIEGVRYRPTQARYKIYIIDEVHMLSKSAFNALLKTLEEPPEHVKFIFATTEIRKIPVTVLSRCQRFDLRRVDAETLASHFERISEKEGAKVSDVALKLIGRAADGSVRDGLSLLDQAIAHADGEVGEAQVREMLGLADRGGSFDLLDKVFSGDIKAALDGLSTGYHAGADPTNVIEDLLDIVHWITRIKIVPDAANDPTVPEIERTQGAEMASRLRMAELTRTWQMLLKGLKEVREAPGALQAAEMVLIRLSFAANLPSPADAIQQGVTGATPSAQPSGPAPGGAGPSGAPPGGGSSAVAVASPAAAPAPSAPAQPQARHLSEVQKPDPATFEAVVDLADQAKEAILHANLVNNLHLVSFQPGEISFRPGDRAPETLASELAKFLNEKTSRRWTVNVALSEAGDKTLAQAEDDRKAARRAKAAEEPLVKAVLATFPDAKWDISIPKAEPTPVDPTPAELPAEEIDPDELI